MKYPIRILQIVSSANPSAGVRNVVVGWHKWLDTSLVQFDYLYVQMDSVPSQADIVTLGANYYVLPSPYRFPWQFLRKSYRFFQTHAV